MRERMRIRKALAENIFNVRENPNWGIYNSSLEDFGMTFANVLPKDYIKYNEHGQYEGLEFKKYIEKTIKRGGTAIEFGGPGSRLFQDFKGFFSKTVGVCLVDKRKPVEREDDENIGHFIVEENMLNDKNNHLLTKISRVLEVDKVDLIISRSEGALDYINKHPAILDHIIRTWYSILSDNGLMFIQFEFNFSDKPLPTEIIVKKWSNALKSRFPEIDIQADKRVLRLHKRKGSPEKLPPATQLFK